MSPHDATVVAVVAIATVVLGVAALWWHFVESPSRRRDALRGAHAAGGATAEGEPDERMADDYDWREGWLEGEVTALMDTPDAAEGAAAPCGQCGHCERCRALARYIAQGISPEMAEFYLDQDAWLDAWKEAGREWDEWLDTRELANPWWTHKPEIAV